MSDQNPHLEALQDIRMMMQRSSRFISLSGLSGIAAGIWALAGAFFAFQWIRDYYKDYNASGFSSESFHQLKMQLLILALAVLAMAVVSALYFTWKKAGKDHMPLWDHASRLMLTNIAVPILAGGIFIIAMLQYDEWRFVAPASLLFYGLALVNGSKYTFSEIRYLGICEIVLGLINMEFIGYGIYFWAIGFGLLHIIYGFFMWWKNERKPEVIQSHTLEEINV